MFVGGVLCIGEKEGLCGCKCLHQLLGWRVCVYERLFVR